MVTLPLMNSEERRYMEVYYRIFRRYKRYKLIDNKRYNKLIIDLKKDMDIIRTGVKILRLIRHRNMKKIYYLKDKELFYSTINKYPRNRTIRG